MAASIKDMQLYTGARRIYRELETRGIGPGDPLKLQDLTPFDQLHYHGTEALDQAIAALGIAPGQKVLEIGAGWGGPARYVAAISGAHVTAVELQSDYNEVGQDLTRRAGLDHKVTHICGDFHDVDLPEGGFDHVVSWLALYHIPDRPGFLAKAARLLHPKGQFWAEDLTQRAPPRDKARFQAAIFANSLVDLGAYRATLEQAGFTCLLATDMTQDWSAFTKDRLQAFLQEEDAFIARHGPEVAEAIRSFYTSISGYFDDGTIGGARIHAKRA